MNAARDINASERTGETYSLHEELGNGEEKLTLEEVLGKPDNMDAEEFAEIVIEEIASDRLSATSQNILWLRLILGYNPRDIEKVLDTNNKAVRNCTHQFKVYLTEKYGYFK
jgi:DNA-directed RNA polymerase specialized sigma24 family protein